MITKPMLPPKRGYVEVEIDGKRVYQPVGDESASNLSVWDELDAAYQEGVNSV